MHQIEMGSSGRAKRPHRGGVLRIYRQCDPHPTVMIKTIANTYFLANIAPHPHNMEFRCAACDHSLPSFQAVPLPCCLDWMASQTSLCPHRTRLQHEWSVCTQSAVSSIQAERLEASSLASTIVRQRSCALPLHNGVKHLPCMLPCQAFCFAGGMLEQSTSA